jgi:hypothetical protein
MSRRVNYRISVAASLAIGAVTYTGAKNACGQTSIYSYQPVGSFTLPADLNPSSTGALYAALPTGSLLVLDDSQVLAESGVGTGSFNAAGTLPASFTPNYGPSFLTVAPGGGLAAAGDNSGHVAVLSPTSPATATVYSLPNGAYDFDARFASNNQLAISDSNGVDLLNTSSGTFTNILDDVGGAAGGASGGIAFDAAGNLYTADGFYYGTTGYNETGLIKEFSKASWQAALASNTPLDFETDGTPIAQLLSASSIGFDNSGNFFVGGADSYGTTGDYGYDVLVSAGDIAAAIASPQATAPITATSSGVEEIADPYGQYQPGYWTYDAATGDLYLKYANVDTVTEYAPVPEPASMAMLALASPAALLRRRRGSRLV